MRRILLAAFLCLFMFITFTAGKHGPWRVSPGLQEVPQGHFLLLTVEARCVFDVQAPPGLHAWSAEWTGDVLIAQVPTLDRLLPPPARMLYQVMAPEEMAAWKLIPMRSLPQVLAFPLAGSHFSGMTVLVRSVSGEGEVGFEVAGEPLGLAPGEVRRVGVVPDPSGGFALYDDPGRWRDRLEAALARGEPAAVLVVHNAGWVENSRVRSPEEVIR